MTLTFPLILDILIVILLSATIGFAIVLNRRLSRLRDNKSESSPRKMSTGESILSHTCHRITSSKIGIENRIPMPGSK